MSSFVVECNRWRYHFRTAPWMTRSQFPVLAEHNTLQSKLDVLPRKHFSTFSAHLLESCRSEYLNIFLFYTVNRGQIQKVTGFLVGCFTKMYLHTVQSGKVWQRVHWCCTEKRGLVTQKCCLPGRTFVRRNMMHRWPIPFYFFFPASWSQDCLLVW